MHWSITMAITQKVATEDIPCHSLMMTIRRSLLDDLMSIAARNDDDFGSSLLGKEECWLQHDDGDKDKDGADANDGCLRKTPDLKMMEEGKDNDEKRELEAWKKRTSFE